MLAAGPAWLAVGTGVVVLVGSVAVHVGYVRGRVARSAAEVGAVLRRRPEPTPVQTGTARASSSST